MSFVKGKTYEFDEINTYFLKIYKHIKMKQEYLPEKEGKIVCGLITIEYNPKAPDYILVGRSKNDEILRKAQKLALQVGPIPIFLRWSTNIWEYKGEYLCDRISYNPSEFADQAKEARREDVIACLMLKPS